MDAAPHVEPVSPRALQWASWGALAVWVYALVAALQIMVWNPLAAAPTGRTLDQVYADLAAAGESFLTPMVLGLLAIGPLAATALLVATRRGHVGPRSARLIVLGLVTLGSPGYFWASFGPGMSLADTYFIRGADHAPWGRVLTTISGGTFIALAVLLAARTRRRPRLAASAER